MKNKKHRVNKHGVFYFILEPYSISCRVNKNAKN